uniref:Uncharacterized protein n=1 Tax=Oryza brachyantha TaxID=4533 RepID=J3N4M2_ORYBR
MMSASPEFYKPAPVFSPCSSPLRLLQQHGDDQVGAWGEEEEYSSSNSYSSCRTPTGGEGNRKAPGTGPPAPRKPRAPPAPCRKRLFEVEVFSLRLEELERPRSAGGSPPSYAASWPAGLSSPAARGGAAAAAHVCVDG